MNLPFDFYLLMCSFRTKKTPIQKFFDTFTLAMEGLMVTMVKNPHVDRIIDFIAKLASSLSNQNKTLGGGEDVQQSQPPETSSQTLEPQEEEEYENAFLTLLIDYLIANNKSNSDAVRYRCCQILSKLMGAINNEQFIDEDLYDRLCDALLERLKDVNSRVQVQAVAAIYRLQDPNDRECRVMKALLFLLTYDPHWQVRYQALSHVAFSKVG